VWVCSLFWGFWFYELWVCLCVCSLFLRLGFYERCVCLCVFSLFFLGLGFDELCFVCSFCHLSVTLIPLLNVVVSNQAF
jgi:hypothetical protein